MKELGYGQGYRYAHDEPEAYAAGESYFPDGMEPARYYEPVDRGLEIKIGEALARLRRRRGQRSGQTDNVPVQLRFARSKASAMLDPKLLRTDPEAVAANLARRGFVLDVARFRALEERRKAAQVAADETARERNAHAKKVGMAKGKGEDIARAARATARRSAGKLAGLEAGTDGGAGRVRRAGAGPAEPAARQRAGRPRRERQRRGAPLGHAARVRFHAARPRRHRREARRWLDFEAAGRISGARFVVLRAASRGCTAR